MDLRKKTTRVRKKGEIGGEEERERERERETERSDTNARPAADLGSFLRESQCCDEMSLLPHCLVASQKHHSTSPRECGCVCVCVCVCECVCVCVPIFS